MDNNEQEKANELLRESEATAIRTTLDRVDHYLVDFADKLKGLTAQIEDVTTKLVGNGQPGLYDELSEIKRDVKLIKTKNDEFSKKLDKVANYEKIVKHLILPTLGLFATNLGLFLWQLIKFAASHGFF